MEDKNSNSKETSHNANNRGEIKFIRNKKNKKVRYFFKGFIFLVAAASAGAVGGMYVTEKKYSKYNAPTNLTNIQLKENNSDETENIKSQITKVTELVAPAVVGISNKPDGFFGEEKNSNIGSGIIFDPNGYIVTNCHLIQGNDKIFVKLSSGKIFDFKEVSIVGEDSKSDLAVIKVNSVSLPTAKFGDSSKVKVGDTAIAIGNPCGEQFVGSVTSGIISSVNKKFSLDGSIYRVIKTDANIGINNSGGPLCNVYGEVIGINSIKVGDVYNTPGMGFAISMNEAKSIIKDIMTYGKVSRPNLGVRGGMAIIQNKVQGYYVSQVENDTPAQQAGIKPTDIILEVNNKKITRYEILTDIIENQKMGEAIKCKIWRNGETLELNITLKTQESPKK